VFEKLFGDSGSTDRATREARLRQHKSILDSVTEKLLAYARGRMRECYDRPAVRKVVPDAAASDYRWSSLILGIVKSPPFQMRKTQLSTLNAEVSK